MRPPHSANLTKTMTESLPWRNCVLTSPLSVAVAGDQIVEDGVALGVRHRKVVAKDLAHRRKEAAVRVVVVDPGRVVDRGVDRVETRRARKAGK